jgi:hypothetical protein
MTNQTLSINQVPYMNFNQVTTPSSPIIFEASKEATTPVLKDCVELTIGAAEILHPKYSTIYLGIKGMRAKSGGDYCRGIENAFGFLLLAASPVLEPCRIIGGGLGVIGGAIGTAVVAPVTGTEKNFRKALNSDQLNDPALKRQALINAFTKRMRRLVNSSLKLTADEKLQLMGHPQKLIALSAIALAYNSKNEFINELKMADNSIIKRNQIETLDEVFKDYFMSVCQLKSLIKDIERAERDFDWRKLMERLDNPFLSEFGGKETRENYVKLGQKAIDLAEVIIADEGFQQSWNAEVALINNNNNNNNQ